MKWSDAVQFICAVIVLCIVFIIATLLGEAHVNLSTIFEAIFHYNPKIQAHNVISEVRIPRNIGAVLVGMALATAGAVIQGVSKNGLADPGLIGLNAGAAFALALTFALFPGASFIAHIIAGFIGAMLGGAIVMTIGASRRDGFNPMRLILAGAAVSALLTALSQGVALIFRLNQAINFWSAWCVRHKLAANSNQCADYFSDFNLIDIDGSTVDDFEFGRCVSCRTRSKYKDGPHSRFNFIDATGGSFCSDGRSGCICRSHRPAYRTFLGRYGLHESPSNDCSSRWYARFRFGSRGETVR